MSAAKSPALPLSEIHGPFLPCPISEQETVIQIDRDGDTATVYTNDLTMLTKLKRAANAKGSQWRLIAIDRSRGRQCGWRFECPKRLISYRAKRLGAGDPEAEPETEAEAETEEE